MPEQPVLEYSQFSKSASVIWLTAAYLAATWIFYYTSNSFAWTGLIPAAAIADIAATLIVFGFSLGFDNTSVYDPYWSVAPLWVVAFLMSRNAGTITIRQGAVVCLVAVWAIRLTWNCLLRWQGMGDEDWRYRAHRHRRGYWIFSLIFLQMFPTLVVLAACLPLFTVFSPLSDPLNGFDLAALCLTSLAILLETLADRELRISAGGEGKRLVSSGVWKLFRHPNYTGEVAFWWGLYLFGLAAGRESIWTVAGPVIMTMLFVFISVPMMDRHMREHYPDYFYRCRTLPLRPFL